MTWTRLSDDFSDDCFELSDAAFRLHTEGLVWSNRKLLDLRLRKEQIGRWATHPDAAEELVAVGWWRDEGDHYVIIHHAAYQRTREVVLKLQAEPAHRPGLAIAGLLHVGGQRGTGHHRSYSSGRPSASTVGGSTPVPESPFPLWLK